MACRRSGVRIPLAPQIFSDLRSGLSDISSDNEGTPSLRGQRRDELSCRSAGLAKHAYYTKGRRDLTNREIQVSSEVAEIAPELLARARSESASVVVMPIRQANGQSVYPQESLLLVKRLRAAGIDARFLDSSDKRTFEVQKSAFAILGNLVLGIASSAAWDGVKRFFGKRPDNNRLSITYVDLVDKDGTRGTAWKVEGDGDAVLRAIDKIRQGETPQISERNDSSSQSEDDPEIADDSAASELFSASGTDADLREAYLREQIEGPRSAAKKLLESAQAALSSDSDISTSPQPESDSRAALALFAQSLNWAEDTDEEANAHQMMDDAGAWVRRTFGCQLARNGDEYKQTCPVALAHNRMGMSIGGTAKRLCSICGEDLSECDHMPGTAYLVPGGKAPFGWCRVCLKESCDHDPSVQYRVSVISYIREMEVHEVSLVDKPAHPDARIFAMSVPVSELKEALGDEFSPGDEVSCDRCLLPCPGLLKRWTNS